MAMITHYRRHRVMKSLMSQLVKRSKSSREGETSMDSLNDPHKVSFLNVCDKRRFHAFVLVSPYENLILLGMCIVS